jgi:hypothetical protein
VKPKQDSRIRYSIDRTHHHSAALAIASSCALASTSLVHAGDCDPQDVAKILASDVATDDVFGTAVAIDGHTAIVGAPRADYVSIGSAYIFDVSDPDQPIQVDKLTPSDGASGDKFGFSVAIDGDTAVIGARLDDDNGWRSGSVYIFRNDGNGNWLESAKITASDGAEDDGFGRSVAISGNTVLVGAPHDDDDGENSGSAYVFDIAIPGDPVELTKLLAQDGSEDSSLGRSVAIDGDTAIVGAYRDDEYGYAAGSAYLFRDDSGSGDWVQVAKITASDAAPEARFGNAVAIDGDTAVVGAYSASDHHGEDSGAAYVFERTGDVWIEKAKLNASDGAMSDLFGYSVAIYADSAMVGAVGDDDNGESSGSVYIFRDDGNGNWIEIDKITASDGAHGDSFGCSVAIDGDTAIVGASGDDNIVENSGSAYLFDVSCISTCPADINGDATVDVLDLLAVLAAWGESDVPEDLNGDGTVDVLDLLELLAAWGPCE